MLLITCVVKRVVNEDLVQFSPFVIIFLKISTPYFSYLTIYCTQLHLTAMAVTRAVNSY